MSRSAGFAATAGEAPAAAGGALQNLREPEESAMLNSINLDDKSYEDFLAEAISQIPL